MGEYCERDSKSRSICKSRLGLGQRVLHDAYLRRGGAADHDPVRGIGSRRGWPVQQVIQLAASTLACPKWDPNLTIMCTSSRAQGDHLFAGFWELVATFKRI